MVSKDALKSKHTEPGQPTLSNSKLREIPHAQQPCNNFQNVLKELSGQAFNHTILFYGCYSCGYLRVIPRHKLNHCEPTEEVGQTDISKILNWLWSTCMLFMFHGNGSQKFDHIITFNDTQLNSTAFMQDLIRCPVSHTAQMSLWYKR